MKTRLSTKGQLIVPKEVRDRHGWVAGCELTVEERGAEVVLRLAQDVPQTSVDDLIGCVGYRGPRRSLRDHERAIAKGAKESR